MKLQGPLKSRTPKNIGLPPVVCSNTTLAGSFLTSNCFSFANVDNIKIIRLPLLVFAFLVIISIATAHWLKKHCYTITYSFLQELFSMVWTPTTSGKTNEPLKSFQQIHSPLCVFPIVGSLVFVCKMFFFFLEILI